MKLRIKLALAMGALVATLVVAAVLYTGSYLVGEVRVQLLAQLGRTNVQLKELQQARLDSLSVRTRLLADEPRLKALVNSTQLDAATIGDAAQDLREVAGSDLFFLLSPSGEVKANISSGKQGAVPPGVVERLLAPGAERQGVAAAYVLGGELYLVAGHVITLGDKPAGLLVTGERLDDRSAGRLNRETNTALALVSDGRVTASAVDEHLRGHLAELASQVAALAAAGPGSSGDQGTLTVDGRSYLAQLSQVERLERGGAAVFVLLRSLDEAMATSNTIRRDLLRLGAGALALALLAALVLASTLARRVGALARATGQVAAGDLDTMVPVGGQDEIGALGRAFNDMVAKLRISREELRNKERLERELEIATVIQTLLLPAQPSLDGFDVAAQLLPSEEVGGDFYDLHQSPEGGAWVAIGDVSGKGVTSGLIMMMVQSMLSALARHAPQHEEGQGRRSDSPQELLRTLNSSLYDNLKLRMHDTNRMTLVLLRHLGAGRFRYAGAHQSLLIHRHAQHRVDVVPTEGTFVGVQEDVGPYLQDREIELAPGDTLLLFTDGASNAKNGQGVPFGVERLQKSLLRGCEGPRVSAARARDVILEDITTWCRSREDDVTLLLLHRLGGTL